MDAQAMLMCSFCRGLTQHENCCERRTHGSQTIALFSCVLCGRVEVLDVPLNTTPSGNFVVYPRGVVNRDGIPDEVMRALDEALIALTGGAFNLAVNGVRTALQIAMRQQGAKAGTLWAEITSLAEKHVIPPTLAEWAHSVRAAANEAVHPSEDTPFGEDDAKEVLALAQSIFDYLYVVPAAVERRRKTIAGP